jgi:hypothetical protein
MAKHPYAEEGQLWGPWLQLDGECAYHLNERPGSNEEECRIDQEENLLFFRNKHELRVTDGHVDLFCLSDPGCTGIETRQHERYREEENPSVVLGTRFYDHHLRELAGFDEMLTQLSWAKATGTLGLLQGTPVWTQYLEGRAAQVRLEQAVAASPAASGRGNDLARWMLQPPLDSCGLTVVQGEQSGCDSGEPSLA